MVFGRNTNFPTVLVNKPRDNNRTCINDYVAENLNAMHTARKAFIKQETMQNFIIQFLLKVNKVKSYGTVLSEGVLGYTLLNSANLSEDKRDMVKATYSELNFNNVKAQLEKIGFPKCQSKCFKLFNSDPRKS